MRRQFRAVRPAGGCVSKQAISQQARLQAPAGLLLCVSVALQRHVRHISPGGHTRAVRGQPRIAGLKRGQPPRIGFGWSTNKPSTVPAPVTCRMCWKVSNSGVVGRPRTVTATTRSWSTPSLRSTPHRGRPTECAACTPNCATATVCPSATSGCGGARNWLFALARGLLFSDIVSCR